MTATEIGERDFPALLPTRADRTHRRRVDAMGCRAELFAVGGTARLLDTGQQLLNELEQRWSRFLPTSDLSRINASAGTSVHVHWSTRDVLLFAVAAWRATDGAFDPTVHAAIEAYGYNKSFEKLASTPRLNSVLPVGPTPGCDGIVIDADACTVRVPHGVSLDLGGIGKGYAADVIVAALRSEGAHGAMVNIGGDIRVDGEPPIDDTWDIQIENSFDEHRPLGHLRIIDGAAATSSPLVRRWARGAQSVHHMFDPRVGGPSKSGIAQVTVLAGAGWWAEALTKAVVVGGADAALATIARLGAGSHAVLVRDDRGVVTTPLMSRFFKAEVATTGKEQWVQQ